METTTTKQAKDEPISNGYILVHNADRILRKQIFTRRKALLDYGNDISVAESRGEAKKQSKIIDNMRKNGFTEEQIRLAIGEDY